MKSELKYIELKSGFSDNGPAWIGMTTFSKSGRTIYFNGKALKSLNGTGIAGNFYDLESGNEYWVSGIKKDGTDRHWTGGGKIMIDRELIDLYLSKVNFDELDKTRYECESLVENRQTKQDHSGSQPAEDVH
ncbi:MAG: hypothetical protein WA960_08680 [Tunicatimonas sp.]